MDVTREERTAPWRRAVGALQRLLLPAACLACGQPLGAGRQPLGLCLPCRGRLRRPVPGCAVCGAPLEAGRLRPLADGFTCGRCRSLPPAYDRLWAAWSYEGPLPPVIGGLKYRRLDYLGGHLAEGMADALLEGSEGRVSSAAVGREPAPAAPEAARRWDLVVPVPLHWRRRWLRGFNQAERIARPLARRLGIPFRSALRRRRPTRRQARLARAARLANPAGAFIAGRGEGVATARVLLVDDVATTGATLDAAARALLEAGAAGVTAAVAARTPEHVP